VSWVGTIWVMRILAPSDYGLVAICTAVLTLVTLVAELGFGAALVQAVSPTSEQVRSVFGAALLFSLVCALGLAAAAPLLGALYAAPQAVPMMQLSALTLVFTALSTVPDAFLRREMAFARISLIEFFTGLVGTVLAVALALAGFGAWSLIAGPVAATAVRAILMQGISNHRVLPSLDIRPARELLGYGFKVALSRLASFVFGQADVLIGARVLTKPELGVYSIAMHLAHLPMTKLMGVLNTVAFPSIAQLHRSGEAAAPILLQGLRVVGHVVVPLLWGLGAVSPWLLPLLLGPGWAGAVLPLQIVCLALPLRLVSVLLSTALQAMGQPGTELRNTLTGVVLLPLLFGIGSLYGANGLASAWLVGLPLLLTLNIRRAAVHLGFGIAQVLRALVPSIACSLAMGAAIALAAMALGPLAHSVAGVLGLCLGGASSYLALLWMFDRASAHSLLELVGRRH
jgi:teichuronic acid exporter